MVFFDIDVYLDFFYVDCEFHENGRSGNHTSLKGLKKFLSYIPRSLFHLSDVWYKTPPNIPLQHLRVSENRSMEDSMFLRA